MPPPHSSTSVNPRKSVSCDSGPSPRADRAHGRRKQRARRERQPLARYTDSQGRPREVIARQGLAGSMLVVDRDAHTHGDLRLLAHLAADEPFENAALVCRDYLRDARDDRRRCRALTEEDVRTTPLPDDAELRGDSEPASRDGEPVDGLGCSYQLELVRTRMSIPQLRWCRRRPPREPEPLSLREVVASLESYEPVRRLTLLALAVHGDDTEVSTTALRAELTRVQESPIVLNRRLREVVLATIEHEKLSMSEIAIRCGRVKRDCKGNESGETSWLARRIGLLPEGGQSTPTPWIHSEVLGLIARRGLAITPREVELG